MGVLSGELVSPAYTARLRNRQGGREKNTYSQFLSAILWGMMPPRIWIILKGQGLKSNLLQLALASESWELRFSETEPRAANEWKGLTHLIVDDAGVKNPLKLFRNLKPSHEFQRLIYLTQSAAGLKNKEGSLPITCLTKPFDPRELRDMIAKDVQTHEPKA